MLKILLIGNKKNELEKCIQYLDKEYGSLSIQIVLKENKIFDTIYNTQPDIILVEYAFSEMSCPDLCRRLKNKSVSRFIPVVIITEEQTSVDERIKSLHAGADSFIAKPIDKAELVAIVNVMLRIKGAEDELRKKNEELKKQVIQTSNKLLIREKRYFEMFNAAANAIILIEKDRKISEWNNAASNIFELAKEKAIGKDFEEVISNKVMRADINNRFDLKIADNRKREYQINIKSTSDKKYQILWTINPLIDSDRTISGILLIGQDVSSRVLEEQERKRSEAKLRNNYLFLNTLLDILPSPVYYKDVNGKYIGCNADFAKFYNLTKEQIIGKHAGDLNPPDVTKVLLEEDMQVYQSGKKQVKEVTKKYKDGSTRYFIVRKTAFYNPDKSIGGLLGVMVDITKSKRMEETLRESEAFFKGVMGSANDAIILADKKHKIHFWNHASSLLFGYRKHEIINKSLFETILLKRDEEVYLDQIMEISLGQVKSAQDNHLELIAIKKDEQNFPAEFSISSIVIHKKTFIIIIVKDISLQKQTIKVLEEAKEKAEEADKLKSSFLSNMSHEIRTPMNAIVGFSQLMVNSALDEEKRQLFVEQINLNSDSLLKLIEDIIYVSKIEAGKIEIKKSMVLMNIVLDELYTSFTEHKRRMGKEHLELKLVKSIDNEDFPLLTDGQRFNQIISNLLSNAIKFTENGSVTFGYEVKDEKELLFFVKDTGLGINPEKVKYIFDRFTKISASKTKLYGGTGLGLSITQHLVERLGGEIWVETLEDKGSIFYFTLPYQRTSKKPIVKKTNELEKKEISLINLNILVAEDEHMNFFFLSEALSPTGAHLNWVKNGEEAVSFIESNKACDLVLMDMKMPIMDGYEATARIKKIRPLLPVIAQTAYAMPEEQKKGYQAGCDFYLSKPIDPEILIEAIYKHVAKKKK